VSVFVIELADGRIVRIEASEVTTRTDGSLWLLRAENPKPHPLVPVLVLACGTWSSCSPEEGAPVVWDPPDSPRQDRR
jgi:hypothetical protein